MLSKITMTVFVLTMLAAIATAQAMVVEGSMGLSKYAIEVVLNKPTIKVDYRTLEGVLKELGVIERNEDLDGLARKSWLLRWAVDENDWVYIEVCFKELSCSGEGEKYLTIRVQDRVLIRQVTRSYITYNLSLDKPVNLWKVADVLERLGYKGAGGSEIAPLCKELRDRSIRVCEVYAEKMVNEHKLVLRITSETSPKRGLTHITFTAYNLTKAPKDLVDLVSKTIREAFGVSSEVKFIAREYNVVKVKQLHNETILKNAFRSFILWLNTSKAISIDPKTLNEILDAVKQGYAGWNNRLVYSERNGRWLRYSDAITEFNGCLLRLSPLKSLERMHVLMEILNRAPIAAPKCIFTETSASPITAMEASSVTASVQSPKAQGSPMLIGDNIVSAIVALIISIIISVTLWSIAKR